VAVSATPNTSARFITFEGGEGSGKSTQIKLLMAWLNRQNIDVIMTREPGGTESAEALRSILLTGDPNRWDGMSELLMLYAGRHDHVEKLIKPALAKGTWVICDRFSDSTMAYQGYGHDLGVDVVSAVHNISLGDFTPDLTLIFDIPVAIGLKRAIARRGSEMRYEEMDRSFHDKLRVGYMEIAKNNQDRCQVINADQSIDAVSEDINNAIKVRFNL